MRCPACEHELQTIRRQGVEIGQCPWCRGEWLGRGQLDELLRETIPGRRTAEASVAAPGDGSRSWPLEVEFYDFG